MSETNSTEKVCDKIVRFTIKQGLEEHRFPATFDIESDESSNLVEISEPSRYPYYYFPSGELIYARDTHRVFIGTRTKDDKGAIGGTIVGNKYIHKDANNKIFLENKYNDITEAYNGDYSYKSDYNSLILYHTGINKNLKSDTRFQSTEINPTTYNINNEIQSDDFYSGNDNSNFKVAYSNLYSGNSFFAASNTKDLSAIIDKDYKFFPAIIPDGVTIDFTFNLNDNSINPIRIVNVPFPIIKQWFQVSNKELNDYENKPIDDTSTPSAGFYVRTVDNTRQICSYLPISFLRKKYYERSLTANRVLRTDDDGCLINDGYVHTKELHVLTNFPIIDNTADVGIYTLANLIGNQYFITEAAESPSDYKKYIFNEGYHKNYRNIYGNIGALEWGTNTDNYRGSIWQNIGTPPVYIRDVKNWAEKHKDDKTKLPKASNAANYNSTNYVGLGQYDNILKKTDTGWVMGGGHIDIWSNIGNPLNFTEIVPYKLSNKNEGTITELDTEKIDKYKLNDGCLNLIPKGNYKIIKGATIEPGSAESEDLVETGYAYQSLWEAVGSRSEMASNFNHYNIWSHIGNLSSTDYQKEYLTIEWPKNVNKTEEDKDVGNITYSEFTATSNEIAKSSIEAYKTIWKNIDYIRKKINDLYTNIVTATTKLKDFCKGYTKAYVKANITNIAKWTKEIADVGINNIKTLSWEIDIVPKIKEYIDKIKVPAIPDYRADKVVGRWAGGNLLNPGTGINNKAGIYKNLKRVENDESIIITFDVETNLMALMTLQCEKEGSEHFAVGHIYAKSSDREQYTDIGAITSSDSTGSYRSFGSISVPFGPGDSAKIEFKKDNCMNIGQAQFYIGWIPMKAGV